MQTFDSTHLEIYFTLLGKEILNNGEQTHYTYVQLHTQFGIHILVNQQLMHLHVVEHLDQ
jgi:hypothetical protein